MISRSVARSSPIVASARTAQLCGMFDIEPAEKTTRTWDVELPVDEREWNIGAFIGPSGSGKSTLLAETFSAPRHLEWHDQRAVVDDFDPSLGIMDVTGVLSSVGFSSPPSWLRPFSTLSNGEAFRAEVARTILESDDVAVIDEFTSVVDRTVARIASHAVAKFVRNASKRLVIASCHYDIVDWLQPDWVYDTAAGAFEWRCLQRRPPVDIEVYRSTTAAWRWFSPHHYLSNQLAPSAQCYVAVIEGQAAGFVGVLPVPGIVGMRRASRAVVMPDFQGIGLGNWMMGYVGALYRLRGFRFTATMSHPAFIHSLARSSSWKMLRRPSRVGRKGNSSTLDGYRESSRRFTASFEYVGPRGDPDAAERLELPARAASSA